MAARGALAVEELSEEVCAEVRASAAVEFMADETVDLVFGKLRLPVLCHHLGMNLPCVTRPLAARCPPGCPSPPHRLTAALEEITVRAEPALALFWRP
ncbi:hypothetical protein GCM10018789_59790 [Streptomyces werraensis]|nr:hypothetical protein GCM10018789_59790 [Streptomyces werraensis]